MDEARGIGDRVREARKRRDLTQRDLARLAGVSVSLVTKLEQGAYGAVRLETAHKLAAVLRVPTSALAGGDAPAAGPDERERWEPVRRALEGGAAGGEPEDEPTLAGLRAAFGSLPPLLLAGRFGELGVMLPGLLRDADALVASAADGSRAGARALRAQVRQVAGSLLLHTWQFDAADRAFALAMGDAGNLLAACSVAEEQCWGLIRQGRLGDCLDLAMGWAGQAEPRMRASRDELAAWGRLLVRASAAAIRDNQPAEAADALRLAGMAAAGTGTDFLLPHSPWHVFGPVTVQVAASETAMIAGRPGEVLAIAAQLGDSRMPVPRYAPSHRLDVAAAHAALRQDTEAVGVLADLRRTRPEWLPRQRYAADILERIIRRRRTLTPEMRDLAVFLSLPL